MFDPTLSRRDLLLAARTTRTAPQETDAPVRLPPRTELVNTLEYAEQARRVLGDTRFAPLADSNRQVFDRMTLRPRMMVPTTNLDTSRTLFGVPHFSPILVAPIELQRRFHAEGQRATAVGAAAAGAVMVHTRQPDAPIEAALAASREHGAWFQVFASDRSAATHAKEAISAGVRALCVTVGAAPGALPARRPRVDWDVVGALIKGAPVPAVVKGVMSVAEADAALTRGAHGIIVSTYGGRAASGEAAALLTLEDIVDRVEGRVPVLVDGGFRRGTDILKALALGASAVLVGRPVMWGLAAYGSGGVQGVIEMLQTELARYMAMSGRPSLSRLDRTLVRWHGR